MARKPDYSNLTIKSGYGYVPLFEQHLHTVAVFDANNKEIASGYGDTLSRAASDAEGETLGDWDMSDDDWEYVKESFAHFRRQKKLPVRNPSKSRTRATKPRKNPIKRSLRALTKI